MRLSSSKNHGPFWVRYPNLVKANLEPKAFFYFHTINAYEDQEHIVTDLMAYQDATILEKWDLRLMRNNVYDDQNQAVPTRFVMPLQAHKVRSQMNCSLAVISVFASSGGRADENQFGLVRLHHC